MAAAAALGKPLTVRKRLNIMAPMSSMKVMALT